MEFFTVILHKLISVQYELNAYISSTIRSLNDDNSFWVSIMVLGIAFTYGLVHAIGPGHGKALVALYFSSTKSNYKKAFKMGYMISIIHAISALVLTFGIFFIMKQMFQQTFNEISDITILISAGMIMLVGVYLFYEAYKDKNVREEKLKKTDKSEIAVAFSAGVVPCPGVMTIVLFCILLGHYTLGLFAAIAMSIGMGLTISLAGIFSIAMNRKADGFLHTKAYMLEMVGAALVFLLGTLLLFSALS